MFDPGGHNVRSARFSRTSPNSLRPPTGRVSPRSGSTRRSRATQLSPTVTPIDASDLGPPSAARRCVPKCVHRQTVGKTHDIVHVNAHRRGCKFHGGAGRGPPSLSVGLPPSVRAYRRGSPSRGRPVAGRRLHRLRSSPLRALWVPGLPALTPISPTSRLPMWTPPISPTLTPIGVTVTPIPHAAPPCARETSGGRDGADRCAPSRIRGDEPSKPPNDQGLRPGGPGGGARSPTPSSGARDPRDVAVADSPQTVGGSRAGLGFAS